MLKYRVWRRTPSKTFLRISLICCALGALLLAIFLVYYTHAADHSPDSMAGYAFAILGTVLMVVVGLGYVLRKRIIRRTRVRLHTYMVWHMGLGFLSLGLIFAHSAGNFNPRSGTYALAALILLVISGMVGRALDRIAPRFAAQAASIALTQSGDDRLTILADHVITAKQQAITMAQIQQFRQMPHGPSPIEDQLQTTKKKARHEAQTIQGALTQEQFFLALVQVWRKIHVALSILTLGLIIWHLVYAAMLLM